MSTVTQDPELLNHLRALLVASRSAFRQQRVYERAMGLVLGEVLAVARHTVTQLLLAMGMAEQDWSVWYRLFSQRRFDAQQASAVLVAESLRHVGEDEVYVVAGDGTHTPRCSARMEGSGWLRHPRTPVFRAGLHRAQRWFNGSWLMPAENGYSRAMPLRWLPAFTDQSPRQQYAACTEGQAAVTFVQWLREQFLRSGRPTQRLLMVVDGSYDTLAMWQHLPEGVFCWPAAPRIAACIPCPLSSAGADAAASMENAPLPLKPSGGSVTAGSGSS